VWRVASAECPITSRISSASRESYLLPSFVPDSQSGDSIRFALKLRMKLAHQRVFASISVFIIGTAQSCRRYLLFLLLLPLLLLRKHFMFKLPTQVDIWASFSARSLIWAHRRPGFSSGPLPWQCLCCCVVSLLICAASSPHLDMRYANALATLYDCRSKRYIEGK